MRGGPYRTGKISPLSLPVRLRALVRAVAPLLSPPRRITLEKAGTKSARSLRSRPYNRYSPTAPTACDRISPVIWIPFASIRRTIRRACDRDRCSCDHLFPRPRSSRRFAPLRDGTSKKLGQKALAHFVRDRTIATLQPHRPPATASPPSSGSRSRRSDGRFAAPATATGTCRRRRPARRRRNCW